MHHQSKERKMSKSQKKIKKKNKKKKLTRAFPFGLARFRFNEVRINEVPLYNDWPSCVSLLHKKGTGVVNANDGEGRTWDDSLIGELAHHLWSSPGLCSMAECASAEDAS